MQRCSAGPEFTYSFMILTELLYSPLLVLISSANIQILLHYTMIKIIFPKDLPFRYPQTTFKYTVFERGIMCSAEIHAHGQEARGNLAVLVQSLFHYSLSHEVLSAFWELLLIHTAHWPPGTGPQDFARAYVLKAASHFKRAWSALNRVFKSQTIKRHQTKLKALPCLNFEATTHNSTTFLKGVSFFFCDKYRIMSNEELFRCMIMHAIQFSSAITIKIAIIL